MEKLQAALDKARKTRSTPDHPPRLITSSGGGTGQPRPQDALWQALETFTVNPRDLETHRVVTHAASEAATPFDILRTKVLLQMRQQGWKRLAITSPMPQSGKTTTACNLALGLGRQRDLRAMLFDLDLRDPSVHDFFETTPPHSIGDLLTGDVDFAQQALRIGDNVAVSMSRGPVADPTRLLLAEQTAEVLDRIEADYAPDLMIFDLPSVLVNDDTRAFLKNADCALIVIRADATHYSQFNTCEREIAEQTNVLGVVLNAYRYGTNRKSA
ncbi:MAG: CpsD/CapB family tyrosine-protein kinase [Yoonia sp.]|nr:CpsD/CapB family tyrosine-protein kinase [Yoonia sp.]